MIRIAKTKALISCAVLCFRICKKLFSHNEAHFSERERERERERENHSNM